MRAVHLALWCRHSCSYCPCAIPANQSFELHLCIWLLHVA